MPVLGSGDLLIRVVGSSVNPIDWKIRRGNFKALIPYSLPVILGRDVCGIVHAVGSDAAKFKFGDEVYANPDVLRDGTYAEFVAVRESEVARKPATISHIDAATLPLAGLTAWQALVNTAKLVAGQRVLILGAAGGVGTIAVQLATTLGARVLGTGSPRNRQFLESLGVDEFIDYHDPHLERAARDVNVVFDTIGGPTQEAAWAVMAPGGILVSTISPPPPGYAETLGFRGAFVSTKPDASALEQIAAMVDAGRLRPVIAAEFALADIRNAHAMSESGRARGKIALYVNPP